MLISCPLCHTRYNVGLDAIGEKGRRVRCARCAYVWHQRVPGDDDVLDDDPAIAAFASGGLDSSDIDIGDDEPREESGESPAWRRKFSRQLPLGFMLFFATLILIASALYVFRQEVASAFPRTVSLYESLGFASQRAGNALTVQNIRRDFDAQRHAFVFSGEIYNGSGDTQEVPRMRGWLLDQDGNKLVNWDFTANGVRLFPGDLTTFTTKISAHDKARNAEFEFVDSD